MGKKKKGTSRGELLNPKLMKFTDDDEQAENSAHYNKSFATASTARKARRKEERKLKKMRKLAYVQKKPLPTRESILKEKLEAKKQAQAAKQKETLREAKKKRKRRKKQKDQEENSADIRVQGLLQANKQEDKVIRQLEKQLKLKQRKSKNLPQSFTNDGLDFLLDVLDPEKLSTFQREETCENLQTEIVNMNMLESDQDDNEETEDLQESDGDAGNDSCEDEDDSDGPELEDSEDTGANVDTYERSVDTVMGERQQKTDSKTRSSSVKFKKVKEVSFQGEDRTKDSYLDSHKLEHSESDIDSSNEEFLSEDLNSENENSDMQIDQNKDEPDGGLTEDIYGRLKDKDGNIVEKVGSSGAYVPPAKRAAFGGDNKRKDELLKIQRQLKGLINRLSESNLQPISNQVEELYRSHSRAETTESLVTVVLGACVSPVLTPERLVMEQALLVAILHNNVGTEVGATFLQKVVQQLNQKHINAEKQDCDSKEAHNLLMLLAHLYNFKVVQCLLLFDVLSELISRFTEVDIELILLLLRTVGFSLRKDDPDALKDVIIQIQKKSNEVDTSSFQDPSRVKFMLEILTAIKNNNMRKIPNYDPSHVEHLMKLLRNYVRRSSAGEEQLRISLQDLLNAEEKGKWWLVGSAWEGRPLDNQHIDAGVTKTTLGSQFSQKLLELARKQRMNTDIRKNIFCVIMTSEDFVDAFENLLRLGLKNQPEREIIHVIVDIALQENKFNPYYAYLTQKFCEYHRRFQMTFQFNLWDRFKILEQMSEQQRTNLAHLLTHLLSTNAASLSLFKVLEFSELDKVKVKFLKQVLIRLLTSYEDNTVKEVFSRISSFPKLVMLREGLKVFMQHFILRKNFKDMEIASLLPERIMIAEKALSSGEGQMML